jgi:hypothetical protein
MKRYLLIVYMRFPPQGSRVFTFAFTSKNLRGKYVAEHCQNWLGYECWDGELTDQQGEEITELEV